MKDPREALMNDVRNAVMKETALELASYMENKGWFNTCLNCCEWNETNELCNKFKERPPAKIIVKGCEHHTDIPF